MLLFLRRHVSFSLKRFFQFSKVLYIIHTSFPGMRSPQSSLPSSSNASNRVPFTRRRRKTSKIIVEKGVCRAMSSNNSKSLYLKTVDGNENLPISEIGLGTISWGDESYGFNKQYREKDLKAMIYGYELEFESKT